MLVELEDDPLNNQSINGYLDEAVKHCSMGLGVWQWASSDKGGDERS